MKDQRSNEETLAMIALARRSLETRAHEEEIRRTLIASYSCSTQTDNKFIRLARAEILADTMRDSEEHLADAFSFYLGIVRDRKAKLAERIKAQQRIDSLLVCWFSVNWNSDWLALASCERHPAVRSVASCHTGFSLWC
jgi:hypothetical protein